MTLLELTENDKGYSYNGRLIPEIELSSLGRSKKLAVPRPRVNSFLNGLEEFNRFVPSNANAYVISDSDNANAVNIQFYHLCEQTHFNLKNLPLDFMNINW